jgi:hypothetical protein
MTHPSYRAIRRTPTIDPLRDNMTDSEAERKCRSTGR